MAQPRSMLRNHYPTDTRVWLLEDDVDKIERRETTRDEKLDALTKVANKILAGISVAAVMLAVDIVVRVAG